MTWLQRLGISAMLLGVVSALSQVWVWAIVGVDHRISGAWALTTSTAIFLGFCAAAFPT